MIFNKSIAHAIKRDAVFANHDTRDKAVAYIVNHFNNYFASNEIMEMSMYYGYLLEYGFPGSTYSTLGTDVCQAIKYVYRGVEKVSDNATQMNLEQIQKSLSKLALS